MPRSSATAPKLRPTAGLLALLVSGYGVSQGMAVPKPRQIEVSIAGLPAAFDGYRVLQLTDIHASRLLTGDWVRKVVDESNALTPDLIVITGDLIDGSVEARREDARPLADLHAPDGVIAITGNLKFDIEAATRQLELGAELRRRTRADRGGECHPGRRRGDEAHVEKGP